MERTSITQSKSESCVVKLLHTCTCVPAHTYFCCRLWLQTFDSPWHRKHGGGELWVSDIGLPGEHPLVYQ